MENYTLGTFFLGIVIVIVAFLIYFLPSFLVSEKCPYKWGVFLVNLFFGLTVIGWIIALVWGMSWTPPKEVENQKKETEDSEKHEQSIPDKYDQIARLKQLLDNGAITETEFEYEKKKLLTHLETEWTIKKKAT